MSDFADFSLFDHIGQRKYLNKSERHQFYKGTKSMPLEKRLFCRMVYFTGARISEVSELKVAQLDFVDKTVIIRTLKQRRKNVYRQIPLPDHLLGEMLAFLDIRRKELGRYDLGDQSLWSFSTRTGSRYIKKIMTTTSNEGLNFTALGLRHGFAVHAVTRVPLTQVQKWMGHSNLKTTAIYLQVSGIEEREWAEKLWDEEG